jgi:hypothetical protein
LIARAVLIFGEIYLVDHFPFKVPDNVPALPINLISVASFDLITFFGASLVYGVVFKKLTIAPNGWRLHDHSLT